MNWRAIPPTLGPADAWQIRDSEGELICLMRGPDQERHCKLIVDMANLANAEWTPEITEDEALAAVSPPFPEDDDDGTLCGWRPRRG